MKKRLSHFALLAVLGVLAGCSVGPNYHRPAPVALPADWHWKLAEPRDNLAKGPWWQVFGDPELNHLEELAVAQNQDLQQAVGRVDEARARARLSGAAFFPQLTFNPSYTRTQQPQDNPELSVIPIPGGALSRFPPYNSFSVPLDLSYEIDIWGRVRRSFESAQALAQASVADYQNVLLTLNSDVAVEYLTLREYEAEEQILLDTAKARTEALRINRVRVQAGRATAVDVAQAESDLTDAQAQLASVQQSRAETANALALLCGTSPGDLPLASNPLNLPPPAVPVGLPTTLLERRPDVAEAERNMASKNALIGVAYAAFYPAVSLTGQGGYLSARATDLFHWQNSIWSFGPSITLPIFTGGQNVSNLQIARAQYNQSVAAYRGAVLQAVRDVENALADLRYLAREKAALQEGIHSATTAQNLQRQRFLVGQTNYTDVIVAEETQLNTERTEAQVRGQELYATVRLIKALGGGWSEAQLMPEQPAPGPFGSAAKLPQN